MGPIVLLSVLGWKDDFVASYSLQQSLSKQQHDFLLLLVVGELLGLRSGTTILNFISITICKMGSFTLPSHEYSLDKLLPSK